MGSLHAKEHVSLGQICRFCFLIFDFPPPNARSMRVEFEAPLVKVTNHFRPMQRLVALLFILLRLFCTPASLAALPEIINVSAYDPTEKQRAGVPYSERDVSALRANGASALIARAGKGGNLDEKCATFLASADRIGMKPSPTPPSNRTVSSVKDKAVIALISIYVEAGLPLLAAFEAAMLVPARIFWAKIPRLIWSNSFRMRNRSHHKRRPVSFSTRGKTTR